MASCVGLVQRVLLAGNIELRAPLGFETNQITRAG